jgi:hypothetical protein
MDTKCPNQVFYVWLVDLQFICAKYGLKTWFSPNHDIRKCLLDKKHISTKNAFCVTNNKKWRKWCKFVSSLLLLTLMVYLCSQWIPNIQNNYFMIDWLIYRLLVLNTSWKRDSLQMMIFVNVCSTWSMVEFKTIFETGITRNDVNGVSLFNLPYLNKKVKQTPFTSFLVIHV